jgi:hypothetical protein
VIVRADARGCVGAHEVLLDLEWVNVPGRPPMAPRCGVEDFSGDCSQDVR